MVSITPLAAEDRTEWLELWKGYLTFYDASLDDQTTEATFGRLVDPAGDLHGVMARNDGGIAVGIVHWLVHPATWTTTDYCYLEDLFVAPDARGDGGGGALIEHVRAWADGHGSAKVYWLTAESNTAARALYDRVAQRSGMVHYQIGLDGRG